MYQAKILPTARIHCDEGVLFRGGEKQRTRPINCYAYLLEGNGRKVLIDTGVKDMDAVNWTKRGAGTWRREDGDADLEAHLRGLGIRPEEITHVILTHAHYDHISAVSCMKNAQIFLSEAEWTSLFAEENPMGPVLKEVREFLLQQQERGKVCLTQDGSIVAEDIVLHVFPGHSPGSQMAEAQTQFGPTLFTGDAVFLLANVEENCPIGFCAIPEGAEQALAFCRKFQGVCMTGHDPACEARFGEKTHG